MTLKLEKPPAANGPLILEVGKTYVDASGVEVRIVAIRRIAQKDKGYAPFIGLRWDAANGTELPKYYFENGACPTGRLSEYLVREYKPPVFKYINVFDSEGFPRGVMVQSYIFQGYQWDSVEEATRIFLKLYSHLTRIAVVKINIETGEVSNEKI